MIVIHPKDKTTVMLAALYDGLQAQVVDDNRSTKEMGHLLHHVSTQECIMLLGHGSDKGLFFRKDDSKDEFDKVIVGHSHASEPNSILYLSDFQYKNVVISII